MGRRSRKRVTAPVRESAVLAPPRHEERPSPSAGTSAPARPPRREEPPTSPAAGPLAGRTARREERPASPTGASGTRRDRAPTPPWGRFPIVELSALGAIVVGVWGLLRGGRGGGAMLAVAALLGSVAGLEVAIREHAGGYRSHTLVLAGTCTVGTLALLFFAGVGRPLLLPVGVAVFAAAALGLRQLFKRRSGGVAMRVR